MAGRIGEYIHLRKKNYLDYGLYHAREKGKQPIADVGNHLNAKFTQRIEELRNRVALSDASAEDQLSLEWTKLLFGDLSSLNKDEAATREMILNMVNKKIKEVSNNLNQWAYTKDFTLKDMKGITEQSKVSKKQLIQIIEKVKSKIRGLKDPKHNIDNFVLKRQYTEILKELNAYANSMKLADKLKALDLKFKNPSLPSFVNLCNTYLATPKSNIEGQIGELLIAALSNVSNGVLLKTEKEIEKQIKAQERSGIIINTSNFARNINLNNIFTTATLKSDDLQIKLRASQNKVDVEAGYLNTGIPNTLASVKYSAKKFPSIKLVEGLSLLTALADEDPYLVNHYLNLASDSGKYNYSDGELSNSKNLAIQGVKLIILYKALTGDLPGKPKFANTFVYINESRRQVKILNINRILSKIQDNILTRKYFVNTKFDNFKNLENTTPTARIQKLLNEVHSQKLSATIRQSDLNINI